MENMEVGNKKRISGRNTGLGNESRRNKDKKAEANISRVKAMDGGGGRESARRGKRGGKARRRKGLNSEAEN